jgi:hypothetical protein
MMHGSGSGYWIQFEKLHIFGRKGRSAYSQRKADPLSFGTKMAPCLWRVDPSFRNSVTGSSSRAKCSNILQDNATKFIMVAKSLAPIPFTHVNFLQDNATYFIMVVKSLAPIPFTRVNFLQDNAT